MQQLVEMQRRRKRRKIRRPTMKCNRNRPLRSSLKVGLKTEEWKKKNVKNIKMDR